MANSTAQTIPLVEVYDYVLAPGDPASATTAKGKSGKQVKVTLQYDRGLTIAPDAVVWTAQEPVVVAAVTDANGFWHVFLVPNNKISPANTYYTVEIDGGISYQIQVTDVAVPAPGWQSSAPGILLNIPSALAPTTSTVGAITATGLITAQAGIAITAGGLSVVGGETDVGGLTVDSLTFSVAVGQIHPGGTSLSIRDNANANDNLLISNAGNVTVRGSLTVTAGPLNVSAGGASITGNVTVTGTLTVTSTLTVSAGGAAITGNTTVTGTLTITALVTAQAGLTLSGGNLNVSAGTLTVSGEASAADYKATGVAALGNAASQRWVSRWTTVGAPTGLTAQLGDMGYDANFNPWICTVAGTPGTWVPVGMHKIARLSGASANYDFTNLPTSGYNGLQIKFKLRDSSAVNAIGLVQIQLAGSAAGYDSAEARFISATAIANPAEVLNGAQATLGLAPGGGLANANVYAIGTADIPAYADTNNEKSGVCHSALSLGTNATGTYYEDVVHFHWRTSGTAINEIKLIPSNGTGWNANSWAEIWAYG